MNKHLSNEEAMIDLNNKATVSIGKKLDGDDVEHNFQKHPIILIGGGSSSGKSNLIQSIICSLISSHKSREMKLYLIDLKKVEFIFYKKLPHLFLPLATSLTQATAGLEKLTAEIVKRIENKTKGPFILVAIDEFADLSLNHTELFENFVQRVAKDGEKTGVGLVIATSNLTPKVITEKIDYSAVSRVGFETASDIDSKLLIKQSGCCGMDKKGSGLYFTCSGTTPVPVQSALITDDEIDTCVEKSMLLDSY